ncbi:MAG: hypothetical protein J6X52_01995 [Clostridia bacterium]|nr:hypothetical protein [Clostridia bacterium]
MIRTNVVELSVIKGIAYRQKLMTGGSGIVIIREDAAQPGIASISKTSGKAIPAANTPKKLYPLEAFDEAIALTSGLPYKKQGGVQLKGELVAETSAAAEEAPDLTVIDSADYAKVVERYTDKNGRLSYDLINRDMIKFAHSSSVVRGMIEKGAKPAAVRRYVVGTKFRSVTGNAKLTDAQVSKIVALLDEVSPKSVLKEFDSELRRSLKAR